MVLGAEKARTGKVYDNRLKCRTRVDWEDAPCTGNTPREFEDKLALFPRLLPAGCGI